MKAILCLIIPQKFFATHSWTTLKARVMEPIMHTNKTIWWVINTSLHLTWKYSWILSTDITCSEKQTVFQESSLRKTVSFEQQIWMSKNTVAPNEVCCVYYPSNIFFAVEGLGVILKIGEYHSDIPQLAGAYSVMWRVSPNRALAKICMIQWKFVIFSNLN